MDTFAFVLIALFSLLSILFAFRNWRELWKKSALDHWIMIGILVFAYASFFQNSGTVSKQQEQKIQDDAKIDSLKFENNSIKYRPNIRVIGDPILEKVWFDSSEIEIKDLDNNFISYPFVIKCHLKLKFRLVNEGNSLADIISIISIDTTSADIVVRRRLLDPKFTRYKFDAFHPFFNNEMLPKIDTLDYNHTEGIDFLKDQLFTLHFLILYENELEQIFDTYYWVQFKIEDYIMPSAFIRKENQIIKLEPASKNLVIIVDSKTSYEAYDRKDGEFILNLIKKYGQTLKQ